MTKIKVETRPWSNGSFRTRIFSVPIDRGWQRCYDERCEERMWDDLRWEVMVTYLMRGCEGLEHPLFCAETPPKDWISNHSNIHCIAHKLQLCSLSCSRKSNYHQIRSSSHTQQEWIDNLRIFWIVRWGPQGESVRKVLVGSSMHSAVNGISCWHCWA